MKYLHGSNEFNGEKFVCANCGKDEMYGKIVCLVCTKKISDLQDKLRRCNVQIKDLKEKVYVWEKGIISLDKFGNVQQNKLPPKGFGKLGV